MITDCHRDARLQAGMVLGCPGAEIMQSIYGETIMTKEDILRTDDFDEFDELFERREQYEACYPGFIPIHEECEYDETFELEKPKQTKAQRLAQKNASAQRIRTKKRNNGLKKIEIWHNATTMENLKKHGYHLSGLFFTNDESRIKTSIAYNVNIKDYIPFPAEYEPQQTITEKIQKIPNKF